MLESHVSEDDAPAITVAAIQGALATQFRVIWALILRETKTRYGEHKIGFLWAILQPLVMVGLFVGLFAAIRTDSPGGMPLVLFMLTGFVPFTMFRDTMTQMQSAIVTNRSLFAFPQVTTFDVIFARGLLELLILAGVFVILLFGLDIAGFEVRIERPLGVLYACGLLALMGMGFGFLFASLIPIIPSLKQITAAVFGRPLFLTSGLFFTADSVPANIRQYMLYNPIMHVMELIRTEFFYEFDSPHGDWGYATTWAVCLFALGLLVHQAMRRRAIIGL